MRTVLTIAGALTVVFALAFTALSLTGCGTIEDEIDGGNDPVPHTAATESDITWDVVQTGGTDNVADSTGIIFTFSESIDSLHLTAANIIVGERAVKGAAAALTGSEKTWTLAPITVIHAGQATVKITKTGIDADIIHVTVYKAGEVAPTLTGITAAYNGTAINPTILLDSLKTHLTVTAQFSDDSEETLSAHEYTLSGALTIGTPTITVTYIHDGVTQTDTFTVTVECTDHDYQGWEHTKDAAPTEDGAETGTCRICGATTTRPLYATGTPGLSYTLVDNTTYRVNRGTTATTELPALFIPAYHRPEGSTDYDEYKPVTQIGTANNTPASNAFGGSNANAGVNSTLTAVTFAENSQITTISNNAFRYCTNLTSIDIPEGVTTIGTYAFQGGTKLADITIPTSVATIGAEAFHNTEHYQNQPDGLVYLGKILYVYKGTMPADTTIDDISNDTIAIAGSAFTNRSQLISITIPASVKSIGPSAFNVCSGLTSITLPEGLTEISSSTFNMCTKLTSVNIPENVKSIGQMAFYGCRVLTEITIPEGVTTIGMQAFTNCIGLTSITIPASVTSASQSFSGCTGLTSAILYKTGEYIFSGCNKLATVTIYADAIAANAFSGCTALTSVTFEHTIISASFPANAFPATNAGNLRTKFYATNPTYGTPGTYIVISGTGANKVWELQP